MFDLQQNQVTSAKDYLRKQRKKHDESIPIGEIHMQERFLSFFG